MIKKAVPIFLSVNYYVLIKYIINNNRSRDNKTR